MCSPRARLHVRRYSDFFAPHIILLLLLLYKIDITLFLPDLYSNGEVTCNMKIYAAFPLHSTFLILCHMMPGTLWFASMSETNNCFGREFNKYTLLATEHYFKFYVTIFHCPL
jgi:hypothetical protein